MQVRDPTLLCFFKYLDCSASTGSVLQHLLNGAAIEVSGGSYFEEFDIGTCAWTVVTLDGVEWIEGGGVVPNATIATRSVLNLLVKTVSPRCRKGSSCQMTMLHY